MLASNVLSALARRTSRNNFRSPTEPKYGPSPYLPATHEQLPSTPKEHAIEPHVDAASLDKPVPEHRLDSAEVYSVPSLRLAHEEFYDSTSEHEETMSVSSTPLSEDIERMEETAEEQDTMSGEDSVELSEYERMSTDIQADQDSEHSFSGTAVSEARFPFPFTSTV